MRRLSTFLLLLLLAVAPGCRALAGAAVLVGEAMLEAAIDGDDDCDDPEPRRDRRAATPNPHRSAARPAPDPCR